MWPSASGAPARRCASLRRTAALGRSWLLAAIAGGALATPSAPARAETGAAAPAAARRTSDELAQLYAASVAYGGLTGVWVHELGKGSSPLSLLLPAAGAAALGAGATAWLDHAGAWPLGLPQALVTDSLIGFEIAAAWVWRSHAQGPAGEPWLSAGRATLLWSGASAGLAVGMLRYALSPSGPGRAAFTGSVTLWTGALAGLTASALTPASALRDDHASLATAIGLEAGVLLSSLLGRWLEPSIGWVRALDAGATLGALLGGGGYLLGTGSGLGARGTHALAAAGLAAGLGGALVLAPRLGLPMSLSASAVPAFTAAPGGGARRPQLQVTLRLDLDLDLDLD